MAHSVADGGGWTLIAACGGVFYRGRAAAAWERLADGGLVQRAANDAVLRVRYGDMNKLFVDVERRRVARVRDDGVIVGTDDSELKLQGLPLAAWTNISAVLCRESALNAAPAPFSAPPAAPWYDGGTVAGNASEVLEAELDRAIEEDCERKKEERKEVERKEERVERLKAEHETVSSNVENVETLLSEAEDLAGDIERRVAWLDEDEHEAVVERVTSSISDVQTDLEAMRSSVEDLQQELSDALDALEEDDASDSECDSVEQTLESVTREALDLENQVEAHKTVLERIRDKINYLD